MENIDRLVAREECKKLFRQPTLVAGDLSLNSNHSEPEKKIKFITLLRELGFYLTYPHNFNIFYDFCFVFFLNLVSS